MCFVQFTTAVIITKLGTSIAFQLAFLVITTTMDAVEQSQAAASPARIVPNPLLRRVSMENNVTPSSTANAALPPPNAPASVARMPEPSPNKSAAAFALSLLGRQQQSSAPPPSTTAPSVGIPNTAPPSAFQSHQQQQAPMVHPTPTYPWQQQQQQYRSFPGSNESPFPAKRQKVSHAQVIQSVQNAPQPKPAATPHHYVMAMHQYSSPYASYPPYGGTSATGTKDGMPTAPTYGNGQMAPVNYGPPSRGYHSPPEYTAPPPMHPGATPASVPSSSMNMAVAPQPNSSSMVTPTPNKKDQQNYSRKTKSLGVLSENFISTYSVDGQTVITIDDAANTLGVERRRIYDVINIFESVDIVQRKCKNTYEWLGTSHLPKLFGKFQQEALVDFAQDAIQHGLLSAQSQTRLQEAPNLGQKKSLGKLSQQFIQLFLVGHQVLSLTDASDKILGKPEVVANAGPHDPTHAQAVRGLKTKIRRLYDISNVFCALGICKKLGADNRRSKPKFQWNFQYSAREIQELHSKQGTSTRIVAATSGTVSATLVASTPASTVVGVKAETPATEAVATTAVDVEQPSFPRPAVLVEPPTTTPKTIDPSVSTTACTPAPSAVTKSMQQAQGVTTANTNMTVLSSTATPLCDNKMIMANINAMGAAAEECGPQQTSVPQQSTDPPPPETELCRTVSLTTDV